MCGLTCPREVQMYSCCSCVWQRSQKLFTLTSLGYNLLEGLCSSSRAISTAYFRIFGMDKRSHLRAVNCCQHASRELTAPFYRTGYVARASLSGVRRIAHPHCSTSCAEVDLWLENPICLGKRLIFCTYQLFFLSRPPPRFSSPPQAPATQGAMCRQCDIAFTEIDGRH